MTPEQIAGAVEAQRVVYAKVREQAIEASMFSELRTLKNNLLSPQALEALLASQPREWTAETISEAPSDRKYACGTPENGFIVVVNKEGAGHALTIGFTVWGPLPSLPISPTATAGKETDHER